MLPSGAGPPGPPRQLQAVFFLDALRHALRLVVSSKGIEWSLFLIAKLKEMYENLRKYSKTYENIWLQPKGPDTLGLKYLTLRQLSLMRASDVISRIQFLDFRQNKLIKRPSEMNGVEF